LLIITWDYEDEIEINRKRIKFLPLWKWLLEKVLDELAKKSLAKGLTDKEYFSK
jgi:hypothetical protein